MNQLDANVKTNLQKQKNPKSLTDPPHNVHDAFGKKMLEDKKHLAEFITKYLSDTKTIAHSKVDENRLEILPTKFINEYLKETIADVVVRIDGNENCPDSFYSVIELKSTNSKLTALQVMRYVLEIMLIYQTEDAKKPLPMVYPIIVYHGKIPFSHPLDFTKLVNGPEEDINKYLRGELQLIDLNTVTDEELLESPHHLITLVELSLKHIYDDNILDFLDKAEAGEQESKLLELFREHIKKAGKESTALLLQYIHSTGKMDNTKRFNEFVGKIDPKLEEDMMTGQQLNINYGINIGIERGIEQGIERGVKKENQQIVLNLLRENIEPQKVAKVCNRPVSEVLALQNSRTPIQEEA